jgi:hypothetical protein
MLQSLQVTNCAPGLLHLVAGIVCYVGRTLQMQYGLICIVKLLLLVSMFVNCLRDVLLGGGYWFHAVTLPLCTLKKLST